MDAFFRPRYSRDPFKRDPDETRGRAIYRAEADAQACRDIGMLRPVRLITTPKEDKA